MSSLAQPALSIPADGIRPRIRRFTRLLLQPREICSLDRGYTRLRVLAGTAWVTARGEDVVVGAGDGRDLPPAGRDARVLSGVGDTALVVELSD
jgi:hypothetical protein